MKLSTLFLPLLTATTAYSKKSKNDIGIKNNFGLSFNVSNKLDLNKRADEIVLLVGSECQKEIDESKEYICLAGNFSAADYKEKCPIIFSDVCDKFYADPIKYFPKCKKEKNFYELLTSKAAMEYLKYNLHFACSTDEAGKTCPVAEVSINGGIWNDDDILKNCASKKCTKALDDVLTVAVNNFDDLTKTGVFETYGDVKTYFGEILSFLRSNTCTSEQLSDYNKSNFNSSFSGDLDSNKHNITEIMEIMENVRNNITEYNERSAFFSENNKYRRPNFGIISSDASTISKTSFTLLVILALIFVYFNN